MRTPGRPGPARGTGRPCQDGRGPDRPGDHGPDLRRRGDGPPRLRPGRAVPRPPRRPAQAPGLRGRRDGAQARLRDAAVRLPVHPGDPQRPRRLPLRLALEPSRSDPAGARPAARGPGRLALQPRLAAQPRRPGRGLPPRAARPPVRPARRRDRRGGAGPGTSRRRGPRAGVPAGLASPRKALRTFLEAAGRAGVRRRSVAGDLLGCLDLSSLPRGRPPGPGPAARRQARGGPAGTWASTCSPSPDTWEADPLVLGRDTEWQVTLARGKRRRLAVRP